MHDLEKIRQFLMGFPGWGEQPLTVDYTDGKPDSCGLFFMGQQELSRQSDVQGNALIRNRYHFVLHRLCAGEAGDGAPVQWLMDLQQWISGQSAAGLAPQLGCLPERETWQSYDGKLLRRDNSGCDVYQLRLQADFYTYEERQEDDGSGI